MDWMIAWKEGEPNNYTGPETVLDYEPANKLFNDQEAGADLEAWVCSKNCRVGICGKCNPTCDLPLQPEGGQVRSIIFR